MPSTITAPNRRLWFTGTRPLPRSVGTCSSLACWLFVFVHVKHKPGLRLVDVGAHEHVLDDSLNLERVQLERALEVAEEAGPAPRQARRDEEEEFVDEVGADKRRRQRRAALEEERLHALVGEPGELVLHWTREQLELRPLG